jgi:hypothetical protein
MSVILPPDFVFHCLYYFLDFSEIDFAISGDLLNAADFCVLLPQDTHIPITPVMVIRHTGIHIVCGVECAQLPLIFVFVVLIVFAFYVLGQGFAGLTEVPVKTLLTVSVIQPYKYADSPPFEEAVCMNFADFFIRLAANDHPKLLIKVVGKVAPDVLAGFP